ncbi:hypothetical protein N5853_00760 [Bartonella sp. HY329]|uniref:hypothetical protein n=1 Tax=unclassified Bartonella TaxID=2645622 RepID=UPI0021C65274|nr:MULTISPECIES: hypothetical protein [unclassified Bartonella]UXM95223.1 hypothetical protein N5853_00760 [Bartonella sp. HY329]UXN09546.1 hypothetical protein N5852_00765 [Bartonella sp. HY328]
MGPYNLLLQGNDNYYLNEASKAQHLNNTKIKTLAEYNLDNHGKITLVREGESVILHIARSGDESTIKWFGEILGAAAYGAYSHPRDVVFGITWGIALLLPKIVEAKEEADECLEIFLSIFKTAKGKSAEDTENNIRVAVLLFLISLQVSTRGKTFVSSLSRLLVGGTVSKIIMSNIGADIGASIGGVPGAAIGSTLGSISAFFAAIAGAILQACLKIRELKRKGEVIQDGLSLILNHIVTGGVDLVSVEKSLGKEAYNELLYLLKNDKLVIKFSDTELQIINNIVKFLFELYSDATKAFQNVFSQYKKDFS